MSFFYRTLGNRKDGVYLPELNYYYLQIYKANYREDEPIKVCGYIYFYLNFKTKATTYIGTLVDEDYRNLGFASLLTALWTWICMDNNFYNYLTNKTQRKPFLIYLLKLYGFEIENPDTYNLSPHTIYICQDLKTSNKCLYFKNPNEGFNFSKSNMMKKDNYQILDRSAFESPSIIKLDQVLVSTPYQISDLSRTLSRTKTTLESHNILK